MKHVLIACVVFALCLAVGLFSLFYVRASGAQTNELLERSIRQAETEDYTGAAASLRQAKQVWEGRERILGIFLHHEEVDEVIALFAQLEQFIRLEDLDDYLGTASKNGWTIVRMGLICAALSAIPASDRNAPETMP